MPCKFSLPLADVDKLRRKEGGGGGEIFLVDFPFWGGNLAQGTGLKPQPQPSQPSQPAKIPFRWGIDSRQP